MSEMQIPGFDLDLVYFQAWWLVMIEMAKPRLAPSVAAVVLAGVVRFAAARALARIEQRITQRTATVLDDHVLRFVAAALPASILAWVAWRLLVIWGMPTPATWVAAIWVAFLFFPLSRLVGDVLVVAEARMIAASGDNIDETTLPLINRGVRIAVVVLGFMLALDRLGVQIQPFLAGAGVVGVALSLAAQDTLSNLVAGVLLILDRPFQVGDRVELWTAPTETGTWGDVVEIGLRATKIRNPDNLVVVVPNNEIMQRDIVNYTMSGDHIRLRIPFSVAYDADVDRAKELLVATALEVEGVKPQPAPFVILRSFGASEVGLQLRVWIHDARVRRRVADEITERALGAFAGAGLEIPYPKRELYIRREKAAALPPG